jgi:hypothetical protein
MNQYIDVWESAASRLVAQEYHAEDLVDDWFSWWGKWMRDSTAFATLVWRTYGESQQSAVEENRAGDAG